MVTAIWFLMLVWFPLIWYALHNICDVLKDILDVLKKGGE